MGQTAGNEETVIRRVRASVRGIVQGVGFRPFVYQLARRYGIKGYVTNTPHGVEIDAEGSREGLNAFFQAIMAEKPPLARITGLTKNDCPEIGYADFSIEASSAAQGRSALISPDVCICEECLAEVMDRKNRRYGYPFINCTNCGPRYTIIEDIPYDRPKTSMKSFPMCQECETEYHDPLNRRFHAQPNACWKCGPQVALFDTEIRRLACRDPITQSAHLLRRGKILAVKGLGGFHLVVDATLPEAVTRLRQRKHREEKPLALMSPDIATIRAYAHVARSEERVLLSLERPIVLLRKRRSGSIASGVAPRNKYFGVMLPYTPLHYLLLKQGFLALVMTSGNLSEEPVAMDNDEAFRRLSHIADYFLTHNRDIYMRCDDSVVRVRAGKTNYMRRARGYVPVPVMLKEALPEILACGGELKNTVCLTKGNNAFLSQHIGDLENLETLESFSEVIEHLRRILEIRPGIIAYDLHPEYLSTKYALAQGEVTANGGHAPTLYGIQHHHAHVVSCMAENNLQEPVIGLALDGTGYGTDGTIWGGEVLVTQWDSFRRAAHLGYAVLPGSAAAVKEPWRMALGYLYQTYGDDALSLDLPFIMNHDSRVLSLLIEAIRKGINTPRTSSCGRLFDGVAALLGLRYKVAYEGQAAVELEMSVTSHNLVSYDYSVERNDGRWILPVEPLIRQIVSDIQGGGGSSVIANKFHHTLASMFADVCLRLRSESGITKVVLSGGVFQNAVLSARLTKLLRKNEFKVYSHRLVPANDGGLSLGQAVAAYAMHRKSAG